MYGVRYILLSLSVARARSEGGAFARSAPPHTSPPIHPSQPPNPSYNCSALFMVTPVPASVVAATRARQSATRTPADAAHARWAALPPRAAHQSPSQYRRRCCPSPTAGSPPSSAPSLSRPVPCSPIGQAHVSFSPRKMASRRQLTLTLGPRTLAVSSRGGVPDEGSHAHVRVTASRDEELSTVRRGSNLTAAYSVMDHVEIAPRWRRRGLVASRRRVMTRHSHRALPEA